MAHLRIIDPGFRTTVQDLGRTGWQRFGVPVSGALDATALRAANLMVGNAPDMAALEIALTGPVFEVAADGVRIAVAGSGMAIEVAGRGMVAAQHTVPPFCTATLARGERVRVAASREAAVGYLAVAGGFAVPMVLGSRATTMRAWLGGFGGRALSAGDLLPLARGLPPDGEEQVGPSLDLARPDRLRVMVDAEGRDFSAAALAAFLNGTYTVTAAADRMGLRLAGPQVPPLRPGEALSEGLAPGAIQIPGDGQPILLLADRQTTGGYPRVAHVIAADLAAAGRLRPGDVVRFVAVDVAAAAAARRARAAELARFVAGIRAADASLVARDASLVARDATIIARDATAGIVPEARAGIVPEARFQHDTAALAAVNLVSGVVSGEE